MKNLITCLLLIIGNHFIDSDFNHTSHFGVRISLTYEATDTNYLVYKIDSVNSFYLIYAKWGDSFYKIISKKEERFDLPKIQVDSTYNFRLHSRSANAHIGNMNIPRENSLLVNCFYFDDSTKICLEPPLMTDLYFADNLHGLHFVGQ
jgi:hypothetical protein